MISNIEQPLKEQQKIETTFKEILEEQEHAINESKRIKEEWQQTRKAQIDKLREQRKQTTHDDVNNIGSDW